MFAALEPALIALVDRLLDQAERVRRFELNRELTGCSA